MKKTTAPNKRLWSVPLPKGSQPASTGPWASSDALFDGSPRSVLVTGGSSAQVVTFFGEVRVVDTQSLDLATGEFGRPPRRTYLSRYSTSGTPSIGLPVSLDFTTASTVAARGIWRSTLPWPAR